MTKPETGGRVFRPAPSMGNGQRGSIEGVWANPGEEVEWCWVHTPSGSYVNGYTIKPHLPDTIKLEKRKKKEHE